MVGSYSNNAFGSGFPQPTGMGNGYRRNPASTRQNQIGNGPNPTGAQTVGQMQPLPGAYGQQGQMQQASGMQPLDTQTAMFKLFNMMKKQRSNVYQPQQEQQYQLTGLPQQKKTWAVDVLNRHLEGDDADEAALQQQQYPQTPPPQQQTSNVYPLSNAAGAMVDTRSREPLDIADPGSQQAQQQQQAPPQQQQAQQPQPPMMSAFSQAQQAQQAQQPQPPMMSAFSQALADSNVNPQPAATPRQRQMADIREQGRIIGDINSSAREMRILGISPAQQQEQRQQSYADRAGTGRGQDFELPPNQQLLAQKQAMEQNAAQQEAAINGSPAYQRAYNGRVKAFGSKGLTDEENAKQQQNEAKQQQKYEDDLAGMRKKQDREDFRNGTPGGRQMDRFDKLLAQRGQQPQQGQYQSNVEQPTVSEADTQKKFKQDYESGKDLYRRESGELVKMSQQQLPIVKLADGRYALTSKNKSYGPEHWAKIAADRQERIANASPALQKRAFDTARRRGQPRGNAVSNAMLRKQGLSPEQISNVYAGTQDKETTQLMRQPQSAVGPAVNGTPTVDERANAAKNAKTNYEGSEPLQQFGVPHDAPWNAYETRFAAVIDEGTDVGPEMLSEIQTQFSNAAVADPNFLGKDGPSDNAWDMFKRKQFKKFAAADTPEKQKAWLTAYKLAKAAEDARRKAIEDSVRKTYPPTPLN